METKQYLDPAMAGFIRGLIQAVVVAAIGAAITYLTSVDFPGPAYIVSLIVALLRTGEGFVDKYRSS